MTVLFAFAWPDKRAVFLGGDDREGHAGARCDKVIHVHGRFLVGGIGNNVVLDAVRLTTALGPEKTCLRDGREYMPPASVSAFCDLIGQALPMVTPMRARLMDEAVADGRRTQAQRDELVAQHGTLVVADRKTNELWLAEFGAILPPRNAYRCALTQLEKQKAYRLGIDDPKVIEAVSKEILQHPFRWAAEQLADAVAYLDGIGKRGILGDLGACFLSRGDSMHARTAFGSINEAMKSFYP